MNFDSLGLLNDDTLKIIDKKMLRGALKKQREHLEHLLADTERMLESLGPEDVPIFAPPTEFVTGMQQLQPEARLTDKIRIAAQTINCDITKPRVIDYIRDVWSDEQFNENSVGAILVRLKDDGELVEISKGVGGQPSVYDVAPSLRAPLPEPAEVADDFAFPPPAARDYE